MERQNKMTNYEYQNRHRSVNFEEAYGDNQNADGDQLHKRKRHSPQQIQELEAFFKMNSYPDENQRWDLSQKLGMEENSILFWFRNKRTQQKVDMKRNDNKLLRQEHVILQTENSVMKELIENSTCIKCFNSINSSQFSLGVNRLKIENARLKNKLNFMRGLASTKPTALPTPNFGAIRRNVVGGSMGPNFGAIRRNAIGGSMGPPPTLSENRSPMGLMMGSEVHRNQSSLVDLALASMDELIMMAQLDIPLWIKSSYEGKEVLNQEEYQRVCTPYISPKPVGYVTEASRETRVVTINSSALVETLLDAKRWSEMFPSMIVKAVTVDVISSGMNGTKDGALLKMHGEVQLPSPLVPIREWNILRFCKKHGGVWVVVDVSIDDENPSRTYKRLPSGCVVQDISNSLSKVTWIDHSEYDESVVHQLYRPLVNLGIGFGAHRWIATLQRQCEFLAMLMPSSISFEDSPGISQGGRRSMLRLAQRMTNYFWPGVCGSSTSKWEIIHIGNNGTRFMSRKYVDHPGETTGNVICAATSVQMPVSRKMLFDFLRDGRYRAQWDLFSNGGSKQEMLYFTKGQEQENHISILRDYYSNGDNDNESNLLCLQDSWTDTFGSMVVYSPITMQSFNMVVNGGDSTNVPILPSGFSILPDCAGTLTNGSSGGSSNDGGGCLLTFGLQQLMLDNLQTVDFATKVADIVDGLISSTIQKIKDAFQVS